MGTYQEMSSHAARQGTLGQSSQLAEPLWTELGLKSGISVRDLTSTLKKIKILRAGRERIVKHSPKILAGEEKATKVC